MAVFRFGSFSLDADSARLSGDGVRDNPAVLTPKLRDLLVFFLRHSGRVVTRDEVLRAVWPDVIVTDNALSYQVSQLRAAFGVQGETLLETIPKTGYRWTSPPERDWGREGEPPPRPPAVRLAVRPFSVGAGGGGEKPGEDLGEGLAESLRMQLGLYPEITVLPGSLAGGGREEADVVVEGSLRIGEDVLRARFRAFDAAQTTLGAGSFDVARGDALALEERIGREVARLLEVPLERLAIQRLVAPATADVAELYWRAKALSRHGWTATREALLLLDRAIDLDPRFASARTLKAQLLGLEVGYRVARDPGWNHDEALRQARAAVEAEPMNPYARSVLGGAMADCGRLDEGFAEASIARAQAPTRASIHLLLGWLYRWAGLLDHAHQAYTIAWKLDPADWRAGVHLSYVMTLRGDAGAKSPLDALKRFGATAETAALEMSAWRSYGLGDVDGARRALSELATREPVLNYVERLKALLAARAGQLEPARRELERQGGYADGRMRFDRAALHAVLDDGPGVLAELEAAERHGFQAPQALTLDPDLRAFADRAASEERAALEAIHRRWDERRRERSKNWP
jgi:adenylate cyclase